MKGDDLRALFAGIALKGCGQDHDAYLRDTSKTFIGLGIDRSRKQFTPLFGSPTHELLAAPFVDSMAGYSVGTPGRPQGDRCDVLLMRTELLAAADEQLLRALLLHEATHWMIDAELPLLPVSDLDQVRSEAMYSRINPQDVLHDRQFLQQLSASAERLVGAASAGSFMESAMKFDALPEDDPEDLETVDPDCD